jgi:hypothetical protein
MGDRCYMSVTCRRQDQQRFEELGFRLELEQSTDAPIIEMVDEEANYAHDDEMPKDIPYTAWNLAGTNYGDGKIACDGKVFAYVSANVDGYVVCWNKRTNQPTKQSLENIRHYLVVHQRLQKLFKALSASVTTQPSTKGTT